jgi:hypothetical protein
VAFVAPTEADFKARFPVFAAVDSAAVIGALAEAAARVDDSWPSETRFIATMLYAAHVLVLDSQGTSTEAQLAGFKRLKIGSLELERSASAAAQFGDLGSTSYGQRFLALMRQAFPAVLVIV